METRSRTRIRATSSPPPEVTEGGTQPVSDEFVGPPSSPIRLSGDGKVSSRSTSLEAGPRSSCHLPASGESAGGMHGPAQGAMYEENREFMDTACSDTVCISTPDVRPISTLVPLLESGTRGVALHSDLLYRASSVASPRVLPISGADNDVRPFLHVSPDQSAPGSFDVAVAGTVSTEDRVGCPPVRPALPLVTPRSFIHEGPQTLSSAEVVAMASPSPAPSNRSLRPTRPIVTCRYDLLFLLLSVQVAERLRG